MQTLIGTTALEFVEVYCDAQAGTFGQPDDTVLLDRVGAVGQFNVNGIIGSFPFLDQEVAANRHRC